MSHMNQPLIGIDKLLSNSWNSVCNDWKPTLGWTLGSIFIPTLINVAFALPQIAEPKLAESITFQLIAFVVTWGASLYFLAGLFRYFLGDKKEPKVSFQDVVSLAWIGALMTLILVPAFLCFIIPGIWLAVAFAMAMPIYLNEGKGGWEALKTSYGRIKGRWWATAINFVVPNLVYGIVVSFIFGILITLFMLITGATATNMITALEKGSDMATVLTQLSPLTITASSVSIFILIICFIITSVLMLLARMSVWTDIYKSVSETAGK